MHRRCKRFRGQTAICEWTWKKKSRNLNPGLTAWVISQNAGFICFRDTGYVGLLLSPFSHLLEESAGLISQLSFTFNCDEFVKFLCYDYSNKLPMSADFRHHWKNLYFQRTTANIYLLKTTVTLDIFDTLKNSENILVVFVICVRVLVFQPSSLLRDEHWLRSH